MPAAPDPPTTMRASQWTSIPYKLSMSLHLNKNAPVPSANSLKSDQVLVRIAYSSLNPVDYKLPELPLVGRLAIKKPASPCADFSGTVVAAGSARPDLSHGQSVFGVLGMPQFGACAEYAVVTGKESCIALPADVKLEQAGAIGVAALTAYQCIVPNLPSGSGTPSIFINGGSGGTGTWGIQIAKAKGCRVTITCSGRNVDFCRELGADQVIDYTKENVVAALIEATKAHGKFDLAVDNVGGASPLYWQAHQYLSPTAKYVAVGGGMNLQAGIDFAKMFLWPAVLGGGKRQYQFLGMQANAEQYGDIARMMAQGKVKAVIEEVYGLEEVGRAFERLYSGRVRGKLVVKVAE